MINVFVVVPRPYWAGGSVQVFSSEDKLLIYYQHLYPEKRSLRLKRWNSYIKERRYSLLNHNTPIGTWEEDIFEVEIDSLQKGDTK